jgi:hypothetical protein
MAERLVGAAADYEPEMSLFSTSYFPDMVASPISNLRFNLM